MAMGVYCDSCKHKELEHKFDKWPCMDCCDGDRRDPVRNADRIRAMSDEELAGFLAAEAPILIHHFAMVKCAMMTQDKSVRTWLDWLRQEASE